MHLRLPAADCPCGYAVDQASLECCITTAPHNVDTAGYKRIVLAIPSMSIFRSGSWFNWFKKDLSTAGASNLISRRCQGMPATCLGSTSHAGNIRATLHCILLLQTSYSQRTSNAVARLFAPCRCSHSYFRFEGNLSNHRAWQLSACSTGRQVCAAGLWRVQHLGQLCLHPRYHPQSTG